MGTHLYLINYINFHTQQRTLKDVYVFFIIIKSRTLYSSGVFPKYDKSKNLILRKLKKKLNISS